MMAKFLYPSHPLRRIICGPSNSVKSIFLTNLNLNIIIEYDKNFINSPSLHQDLYQKSIKCFTNYVPIHIIPNILNEKDFDIVNEEIVKDKNFRKYDTELETYESIEELKISSRV